MDRPGEDTVTFVRVTKGAVKSDRGVPEDLETSTPVKWCSFQPLGVHLKVESTELADATHRCISPPVAAVLACEAGDGLVFDEGRHLVLGVRRHWDRGKIHHVTVITKRWVNSGAS